MNILGVDTGGTFTDFVLLQDGHLRVHKVLSTPDAPERAILDGIRDLQLDSSKQTLYVIHGSTVATNAVLENKGVPTVFITNRGLADMLTIGRQARKQLYNLQPEPQTPPVPKSYCLETGGRLSADASIVEPLSEVDITILLEQIEQLKPAAVAINLLFSFLDDNFECRIAAAIPHSIYVSRSSQILPECKEYERGIATWLNASVGPLMSTYLNNLCNELQRQYTGVSSVSIMQSSAATVSAETAALRAVNMLLSGPAGGLVGAQYVAQVAGKQRLLTFDIGGTSTDVALVDGDLNLTTEGHIGGYPVAVPMVDMHTIGAGGGSIASIDVGGLLKVGPASAGASPGPACYGLGGREA
ncbi:MAG: hydantoinase/oxoprolinase family protein, partial [Thiohalomonadales bacterium]